jgi:intracellular sulfur oxidation DsrE/DsrF family protein
MKNYLIIILINILGPQISFAQDTAHSTIHRIVFQASSSDPLVQKSITKQLSNLKEGWGDSVIIEVVCHGPGIELLMPSKTQYLAEIQSLMSKKIDFVVCENSMRERKVTKEEILAGSRFVKMGLGEIVIKQEKGWSYIKGGF